MKTCRTFLCTLMALFTSLAYAKDKPAVLSDEQKLFLSQYEGVRAGLASDDLPAAKKAASAITGQSHDAAKKLAAAASIEAARESFKELSKQAVSIASGQPGYFRAHCPMVPDVAGDWVQTSKKISNPYFGKAMATCGSIEN